MSYFENLKSVTPVFSDTDYSVKYIENPLRYTTEDVNGFNMVDYDRSLSTEM